MFSRPSCRAFAFSLSAALVSLAALCSLALAQPPVMKLPPANPAPNRDSLERAALPALRDSVTRPSIPPRMPPPIRRDTVLTGGDVPNYWRTRAEKSNYRLTADYDESIRYARQLEAGSRWIQYQSYGRSGQGRDLPLLIVSKDRAFTPEAARATGKPIVLIQNGIHSGEIEGKDACFALVRDIAVLRAREALLDSVILLVLPIYSVDAHERRGRYNRINQNGPEEMGWRSTPIGLNLNRDYLKVEAPETRALIANVYTKWWPELLVDDHTTDGADYRHDVTYSFSHGPGIPAALDAWMEGAFEGRAIKRLAELGHLPAPYLEFIKGNDPLSGVKFEASLPRFSTGYAPLHGRGAILVETHMLKPYGTRVKATYDLLLALLEEIHDRPAALKRAVRDAEAEIVARGRERDPARRAFALTSRATDQSVPLEFKGVQTTWEQSDITGSQVPRYSSAPWDTVIPLFRELAPVLVVQQPVGYLVPQEWTAAVDRLQIHGVRVRRLAKAYRDTVEMARILEWKAGEPFEGHRPLSVTKLALERQVRSFRPGDLWVPLDQRSAPIAVHLLEPQAPDGLLAFNAFDTIFLRKEYGEAYVVEPLAKQMLAKDPKLAAEFRARVAADTAFAKSANARVDFFYRRPPWADPDQDLDPIARALRPVPDAFLAPEPGAAPKPAPAGAKR